MRRLLIFLKYPTPGRVKTRLAEAIGDEAASELYRQCAEETLRRLQALQHETTVCVDPPQALPQVRRWIGTGWSLRPQRGDSLGERLAHATQEAFAGGATRVVVIGTDSPWLGVADIEQAFGVLARGRLVVGPAVDGGYYLIGLPQPTPSVFEGIDWSTSRVCQQTLAKARECGLVAERLRTGYDVDRLEDLERLRKEGLPCPS